MNPDNFLNIWQVLVWEIIGDLWLFIIIALIMIYLGSVHFKLPMEVSLLFGILFLGIVSAATLNPITWVFAVLAAGTLFYYMISSKLRKG